MKIGDLVIAGWLTPCPIVGVVAALMDGDDSFKVFWCDGEKSWERPSTVILFNHEVRNESR
jgi:hypothetical protein